MTTEFDPERGILRVGHAALSVLARLAVAPTDPQLKDHATAPPLAELRRAGILGPRGIHPDVRPLAAVIGAPGTVLDLDLREGAGPWRRCRGWASAELIVVAVPTTAEDAVYDLVADHLEAAPALLGELVGLRAVPRGAGTTLDLDGGTIDAVLAGAPVDGLAGAGSARARWRLAVRAGAPTTDVPEALDVLDDGEALWRIEQDPGGRTRLEPIDTITLRARIAELVARPLG